MVGLADTTAAAAEITFLPIWCGISIGGWGGGGILPKPGINVGPIPYPFTCPEISASNLQLLNSFVYLWAQGIRIKATCSFHLPFA